MAASLDDASGGHPHWLMAQGGAAALKVCRRPKDGLGFGEQRWRAEREDLCEDQAVAVAVRSERCLMFKRSLVGGKHAVA